MYVKKYKGKVLGAVFTADEQKAIDIEIAKQIVEANKTLISDLDAMVLYTLMVDQGWGKKRLRAFWNKVHEEHDKLVKHYECPDDYVWLAKYKLKEAGVDVDAWNAELHVEGEDK